MRTILSAVALAAALGFTFVACGSTAAPPCSSSTCSGCCDVTGVCQPGIQQQACGTAGGLCGVCASNQTCTLGLCQGGASGGGAGTGGGTGTGGGSGTGGGTGGGGSASLTDAQRVTIYCEKTLLAGCSAWFTSQADCEDVVRRTQAAICETKWVAETDCLAGTQASDWTCDGFGEPMIAGTVCRDEFGFGSFCRISVATPACYSGACRYNSDCPSGMSCNDKTEHCFDTQANCAGLPCKYNADCPSGLTCNDALEQCVRN